MATQDTFRAVLRDMGTSLKSMGFKDIIMIADSGGNVTGMTEVAKEMNAKWNGNPARAHYVTEYYTQDIWSYDYLKTLGILQQPDVRSATRWDIHDDYHYESLVALTSPKLIRAEQRLKANKFTINNVEIGSIRCSITEESCSNTAPGFLRTPSPRPSPTGSRHSSKRWRSARR